MTLVVKSPRYQPHASQFAFGPGVPAPRGCCTLLALACCDIVSKGIHAYVLDSHAQTPDPASVDNVQAVMHRMYSQARQHGLCGPNGSATQQDMLDMAKIIGLPVKEVLYYAPKQPAESWVYFLRRNISHAATPYPVLVQVSNGAALVDKNTGSVDEPDLQCHAFALFASESDTENDNYGGYIGADGDQTDADRQTVCYDLATLNKANIISMIAFDYVR